MEKGRTLALTGAWLQLGPAFGLLGTIVGMLQIFHGIALGGAESTTNEVAQGINVALVTTQIGLVVGLVGVALFLIALLKYKYREKWFFWFITIYSILSLIGFPIGTLIGVLLLAYVITRKDEFLNKNKTVNKSVLTTSEAAPPTS